MTRLARILAVAATGMALPVLAADIVLTPPAGGGVAVTNAAANATRLRVADDGTITLPGLGAATGATTNLCLETGTGKIVTCPLPTVLVASLTTCCFSIANTAVGEANARQVLLKGAPGSGKYLARVDAQLNNAGALWFDYHCKLQSLQYPVILGTPFSDIPGTRRDVSWRTGRDNAGNATSATGVSISMQAPVTAGFGGVDVKLVCWGTIDPAGPLYDYGFGVESAVLTLVPVGAFN